MSTDFTWLIGGPQGSGVESGANIFSKVCAQMGYQIFGKENFIQIAAFKNLDKASKVANAVMKAIGENVFIKETESSDPVFHRILVGPFEANMEAAVVDKITSIGIKEFFKTIE